MAHFEGYFGQYFGHFDDTILVKDEGIVAWAGAGVLTNFRLLLNVDNMVRCIPLWQLRRYELDDCFNVAWTEDGKTIELSFTGQCFNPDVVNTVLRHQPWSILNDASRYLVAQSRYAFSREHPELRLPPPPQRIDLAAFKSVKLIRKPSKLLMAVIALFFVGFLNYCGVRSDAKAIAECKALPYGGYGCEEGEGARCAHEILSLYRYGGFGHLGPSLAAQTAAGQALSEFGSDCAN
jgi:hypothetical protein